MRKDRQLPCKTAWVHSCSALCQLWSPKAVTDAPGLRHIERAAAIVLLSRGKEKLESVPGKASITQAGWVLNGTF